MLLNQGINATRLLLSAPEIKIFSGTQHNSTGYCSSSWSVILSETRLLLRLQEPLSQDHVAFLGLSLHSGVKKKGTRMSDPDSIDRNSRKYDSENMGFLYGLLTFQVVQLVKNPPANAGGLP